MFNANVVCIEVVTNKISSIQSHMWVKYKNETGININKLSFKVLYMNVASIQNEWKWNNIANRPKSNKISIAIFDDLIEITIVPLLIQQIYYNYSFILNWINFTSQISLPLEKRRNATSLYNPMTIAELEKKFPR